MRQELAGHPASEACRDLKTKSDVLAACRRGAPCIAPLAHMQGLGALLAYLLAALQLLLKPCVSTRLVHLHCRCAVSKLPCGSWQCYGYIHGLVGPGTM